MNPAAFSRSRRAQHGVGDRFTSSARRVLLRCPCCWTALRMRISVPSRPNFFTFAVLSLFQRARGSLFTVDEPIYITSSKNKKSAFVFPTNCALISPTTPYGVMNNRFAPLSRPWNKRHCWQLCPNTVSSPSIEFRTCSESPV